MTYLAVYPALLLSLAVSSGAQSDDGGDGNTLGPTSRILDDMVGNFKSVELQAVWDELQSRKVVSFSVVRDSTQFLVVQAAWLLAGLLLWRGPAVTRRDLVTGEQSVELLEDKVFTEGVDVGKLNNFFMNPQHVTRNLVVCASLFMITATFWLLPSLLWKKSHLLGLAIPGSQPSERLEAGELDLSHGAEAEERLGGVVTALVDSGLGDIYNRVLCPTCIMQIVIINTMVFVGQMLFWTITSSLPSRLPFS